MPILSAGSNVTLSVAAGQVLTVQSDQATYDFENPVGTRIGEYAYDNVFGPFSTAGSVKLTSVQGQLFYDLSAGQSFNSQYNPANVAISGGSITGGMIDGLPANTSQLRKWRAALARAKTGGGYAKIACVGDSITVGLFSNTDAWTNNRVKAYPSVLAQRLTDAGIKAQANSFFGDGNRVLISATNTIDPRMTAGAGWILSNDSTGLGANPFSQSAAGGAFSFTPMAQVDTFDVWYVNQTGNGVISAQIDALAATTANTGTQGPISKITLTTTLGTHTCNVSWSSGGQVVLLGIEGRNSASDLVSVWNMGAAGLRASQFASFSSGSPWSAVQSLPVYAPDLTIIGYGVNEWLQGYSPTTYASDLQTVISTAQQTGDVLLWVEPPSITTGSPGSFATTATQQAIIAQLYAAAAVANVPVVDMTYRWNSFATSSGFYGDGAIHPNGKGYYDIGSTLARVLAAP